MRDRTELLAKILKYGFPDKDVVLTLDEFFDGNDDLNSIRVDGTDLPSPQDFHKTFKQLLYAGKIDEVFVRISGVENTQWFRSDMIFLVGKIALEDLQQAIAHLHPTQIYAGWPGDFPANLSDNYQRAKAYTIWWRYNNSAYLSKT